MTLDELLSGWASQHRLSADDAAAVRATVLRQAGAEPSDANDPDWLWRALRPLTDLLESPRGLHATITVPYLRLG